MAAPYAGEDREKDDDFNGRLRVNLPGIDAVDNTADLSAIVGEDAPFVHPDARALFAKMPILERFPIFGECCTGYGPKCTSALGLVYFLNKGIGYSLINAARYAMFVSRFGVDATRYQRLASIAKMGFSIKAFAAMMSDTIALFGFTKRWYCAAACVVGAALTVGYGVLPAKTSSADIAAGFVFLTSFCVANVDILSEGHYSRLMRQRPEYGPALVSWIWWFILGATIVAAAIQGPLSDNGTPQIGLFIAGATQFVSGLFFIFNWYGEKTNREDQIADQLIMRETAECERRLAAGVTPEIGSGELDDGQPAKSGVAYGEAANALNDGLAVSTLHCGEEPCDETTDALPPLQIVSCCGGVVEFNKDICLRHWRILVYSSVMVCSVVAMTCVTILGTRWQLLYACIGVVVGCAACAFWALPLVIAKVSMYFFSYAFLYLQLPGALDGFYMATPECYPEGPHFTYVFYTTIGAIIGNVAGIAAVAAFPYLFAKHSIRFTLMFTYFIQVIASVFDIIMVKRWNLHIGIPDHAMYIFGDAIVYQVSYYLAWMPTVILLSRICPRGSESMVYALVAGFGNLGGSMSNTVGSLLMEFVWPIVSKGAGKCDFSNVPMLLLVGHILLPLLIVPLNFILLPAARISEDIDASGKAVKQRTTAAPRQERGEASEPFRESHQ